MRPSRKMFIVLGIVAAICMAVLVAVFIKGLQQDVGAAAHRILQNTIEEGSHVAHILNGE